MATVRGIGVAVMMSWCGTVSPLLHAELVLLVDHHQAQERDLDGLGEQGVRADHDPGLAGGQRGELGPAGRRRLRAGEDADARGVLRGVEPAAVGERAEEVGQRPVVLLGEHLRGREQGGLPPGVDHLQHRPGGHDGLAGAHLAVQEPLHGMGVGEVAGDRLAHARLAVGEPVRELGVEGREQPPALGRARFGGVRCGLGAQPGERGLDDEGLLVADRPRPAVDLLLVLGVVQRAKGTDGGEQPVLLPVRLGQRLGDVVGAQRVQHAADRAGDDPRRQTRGRGVDRSGAARLVGRERLGLGAELVGLEGEVVRVGELEVVAEPRDLTGELPARARCEPTCVHAEGPRARAEEHECEGRRAVRDRDDEARAAAAAGAGDLRLGAQHLGDDGDLLPHREVGERGEPAGGHPAERVVPQQIALGVDAEARELLRRGGAHEPRHGGVQARGIRRYDHGSRLRGGTDTAAVWRDARPRPGHRPWAGTPREGTLFRLPVRP
jgi:hypothetical protein